MIETQTATVVLQDAPPCPPEGLGEAKADREVSEETGTDDKASAAAPERDRLVVSLPEGWRIVETPVQWVVQAPTKSGAWRLVAYHIERDAMIRQAPERLCGPRSGRALPDDVLAVLRALPPHHLGERRTAIGTSPTDDDQAPR